jgi:hypothetical protein
MKTRAVIPKHFTRKKRPVCVGAFLKIANGLDSSNTQMTCIQRVEPGIGGMWIVVAGPQAAADAVVAQQNTLFWDKTKFLPIRIIGAEQAEAELLQYPSLPAKMDAIGLAPDDAISEAGRKVMYFHFDEMLLHGRWHWHCSCSTILR